MPDPYDPATSGPDQNVASGDVVAVILAAGKGTRFKSDLAKVLHRAAGRSLLGHVLEAVRPLGCGQVVVVVGHQAAAVEAEATGAGIPQLSTVVQEEQNGTGHALQTAMPAIRDDIRQVLVLPGDTPLLLADTLRGLLSAAPDDHAGALLTTEPDDPTGYGRVIREHGDVTRVVEQTDATEDELAVREVNAGMYVFARDGLTTALAELDADNAQGEIYLTDVVERLVADGGRVAGFTAPTDEVAGVNDRRQLAAAAAVLRTRALDALMVDGVTVVDPATTYLDVNVEVGPDTVIEPGCLLRSGTRIGAGATIGPNCDLGDTLVEEGAQVTYTVARGASIGPQASVGPFTYLRPGTRLETRAKAGGFVEMKKSTIGEGSKVPHLSYIGDATVGRDVNVGAGTITCNYDGFDKHATTIGDGAFIGSDTMLVAPVNVGAGAVTGAGSAITEDVPDDALAVERNEQRVKEGWAAARRERKHG